MGNGITKQREVSEGYGDHKNGKYWLLAAIIKTHTVTSMGKYLHVRRELYAQPNVVVIGKKKNLFVLSFVALHLPEF